MLKFSRKRTFLSGLGVAILLGCATGPATAQPLTPAQARADFATLVSLLRELSPHLAVKRAAIGYDALAEIEALRPDVDTVTTVAGMHDVVWRAMNLVQDAHFNLDYAQWRALLEPYARTHLQLPIEYLDGEYAFVDDARYGGRDIPFGTRVEAYEGRPVHAAVDGMRATAYAMRYDRARGRWYDRGFYRERRRPGVRDSFTLSLVTPDGRRDTVRFARADTLAEAPAYLRPGLERGAHYLPATRTLYVRVPLMDDPRFYRKAIRAHRGRDIDRVVIDVRGNGGGGDGVWRGLLRQVIDAPIEWPVDLYLADSERAREKYGRKEAAVTSAAAPGERFRQGPKRTDGLRPRLLGGLRVDGPIVVLTDRDVFSSTGSLLAAAAHSDRLTSVGPRADRVLGIGFMPTHYTLPHSGARVRITESSDFTEAHLPGDLFPRPRGRRVAVDAGDVPGLARQWRSGRRPRRRPVDGGGARGSVQGSALGRGLSPKPTSPTPRPTPA